MPRLPRPTINMFFMFRETNFFSDALTVMK